MECTKEIQAKLTFDANVYEFTLKITGDGGLIIGIEKVFYSSVDKFSTILIGSGETESLLKHRREFRHETDAPGMINNVWCAIRGWYVYHFHDTSLAAGMRCECDIDLNSGLYANGENLAAFLFGLRETHPAVYQAIRKTVQRIAPYFDDFVLSVRKGNAEDQVRLTWKQKGKDYIFSPGHLSDGTIRFICLTAALLQPSPPPTIVVDEPELGLHPEALAILAGLFRSASTRMQIIVASQSPVLLSEFEPEQVITVDQVDGASRFQRLNSNDLKVWLDDFSLGELWLKGNIGGGVNNA